MSEFRMPSLGADMEAGTLVEWLKHPGDEVRRGDIIAVVDTQKGAIEIEVFDDGVLERYLVDAGTRVPVGTPLALIRRGGEPEGGAEEKPAATRRKAEPEEPGAVPTAAAGAARRAMPPAGETGERAKITPAARRLAEAKGIDAASLRGTGPEGAIVLADITLLLEGKAEAPRREEKAEAPSAAPVDMAGMRQAIGAAMSRSKREIPHYYLSHGVDLTRAEAFIAAANEGRAPAKRILQGALFVKAAALAAAEFPEFNGQYEEGGFRASDAVHAGVAIYIRGGGLVAPAIHNAESLDLDALMAAMRDLVSRVRAGRFRASELTGSTITISSMGERGVEVLYGVIYPPQVAIVGFGLPVDRPVAVEGNVEVRKMVTVTLAADHRVSDGHRGGLFLNAIDKLLQQPEAL